MNLMCNFACRRTDNHVVTIAQSYCSGLTLVQFEDRVGHGGQNSLSLQDIDVPDPQGQGEGGLRERDRGRKIMKERERDRERE